MKKICMILILAITASLVTTAQVVSKPRTGPPGSWRLIGTVVAAFTIDHDEIIVAGPGDNFRRLKFKVFDSGVNMLRMIVTYDNGVPDEIPIRYNIPQGGESRIIDLRGAKRSIRKVAFWYDTKGILRGKAKVQLWGMK